MRAVPIRNGSLFYVVNFFKSDLFLANPAEKQERATNILRNSLILKWKQLCLNQWLLDYEMITKYIN